MVGWEELQKNPVGSQRGQFVDWEGPFEQTSSPSYPSADVRCCSGMHDMTDPFLSRPGEESTATAEDVEANAFDAYYQPFTTPLQVGQFYPPPAVPDFPFWGDQSFGEGQVGTPFQSPTSVTTSNTSIASPSPIRHPSFSFSDGSPIIALEDAYIVPSSSSDGSVLNGTSDVDGPPNSTIEDRINAFSDTAQHQLRTCSHDPELQLVVLAIHESREFQDKEDLSFKAVSPLLEPQGRGRRGAPQSYRCRWHSCGEVINRRLHAKEHVLVHLEYRRHVCAECGSGFVRKNELNKHQKPCKKIKERNVSVGDVRCAKANPVAKKHTMAWKMTPRNVSKAGNLPLAQLVDFKTPHDQSTTATQCSQSSPRGVSPTYVLNSYHQPTPNIRPANVAYYSSNDDLV